MVSITHLKWTECVDTVAVYMGMNFSKWGMGMSDKEKWLRVRFVSDADDFRPIYKGNNPDGPWWCSGYNSKGSAIIVAYVKNANSVFKQWPEATEVESSLCDKVEFSDRFPKPEWWTE